jgi:thiol-disulfide isomerase/thioredoxin
MKSFAISFILCFLSVACFAQPLAPVNKINYKKKGAPIPPFLLEKPNGGTFVNTQLKKGKPVMLMIFSPQCDHCEHMMDSLKNIASMFKNTQLMLVAEDRNKQFMKGFIEKTKIGSVPLFENIGTERGRLIGEIYNYKILPQVNFYDKNYKLVHSFDGNAGLDSIKMFIQ